MLINEFNRLTGYENSLDEYCFAYSVYMETDLDKKTFCECWFSVNENEVFLDIWKKYVVAKQTIAFLEEYV